MAITDQLSHLRPLGLRAASPGLATRHPPPTSHLSLFPATDARHSEYSRNGEVLKENNPRTASAGRTPVRDYAELTPRDLANDSVPLCKFRYSSFSIYLPKRFRFDSP